MIIVIDDSGGAPPAAYTTLNPSDKSANVTLSGGNLIATGTSASSGIARAVHGKSSGKWYFESVFTTSVGTGANIGAGLANASHVLTASLGYSNPNGWAMWGVPSPGYRNNGAVQSVGTAAGDVIGFAVDLDNDRLWVSRNGTYIAGDPAAGTSPSSTNLTGTLYPAACPWVSGNVVTMRFDPLSHSYSAPSGFTPGWTA